jgi:Zn-dependent protease/CBS domain-containing protein
MGSIRLFRVRGIEIKMHITFPLILVYAAIQFGLLSRRGFSLSGALFGVVVTLILFACVVIHELSHSLTAMRMGFPVRDITLLPLGGVAQIERMPEKPGQEFLMAVAGPLSNVIIAIALVVIGTLARVNVAASLLAMLRNPLAIGWSSILPYLIFTNLSLAAFNLLPAFPMDGGRVLRALLATVMPHARATATAVAVGQALAWLLGLAGLLTGSLLWILVAVFIFSGAAQEGRMIAVKNVLEGLSVRHAFSRRPLALSPDQPLSHAADLILESFQSDFPVCAGELGPDGEPACDLDRLAGLLTHTDLIRALRQYPPDTPVRQVMRVDFPRVRLDDSLYDVQQRMAENRIDAVPVFDGERFLGLLTRRDLSEVYQLLSVSPELLRHREVV